MKSCPAEEDATAEDYVRRVPGLIADRLPEDMTVDRLAEEVRPDPAHLYGLFRSCGLGPPLARVRLSSEADPRLPQPQVQDKRASRVVSAMLAGAATALTVDALAKSVGLTRRHLSRIFRREFGLSPSAVLLAIRMALARRMLSDEVLSVKEVAAQCGMPETSHFSRAFARVNGSPPSVFRRAGSPPQTHAARG